MSPAKVLAASAAWVPHGRNRSYDRALTLLYRLASRLADPYRPEKHYMRGPGPKWRAKHGPLARG